MSGRNTDQALAYSVGEMTLYSQRILDALHDNDGVLPADTGLKLVKRYLSANRRVSLLASAHLGELMMTCAAVRADAVPERPSCSTARDLYLALSGGDARLADLT